MKVVHFSDWHRNFRRLPPADLYICTGDMLPNFPLLKLQPDLFKEELVYWDPEGDEPMPEGYFDRGWEFRREREIAKQTQWLAQRDFRRDFFPDHDTPVICVRGNHDYIPIAPMFGGDVWEIDDDPTRTVTISGLKFGGLRGIPYIMGVWNDELRNEQLDDRTSRLPNDLDVLVTHAPPYGILDMAHTMLGSHAIRRYTNNRDLGDKPLLAHCFGHIHESLGQKRLGATLYSNAATGIQTFEF